MRRYITAGAGCMFLPSQFGLLKPCAPICKRCNGEDYMPNGDACPECNLFAEPRKKK